jgi:hypothetical protein
MNENYPSDWFCEQCKRMFSDHVKVGAKDENDQGKSPASTNWCYSWAEYKDYPGSEYERSGWRFYPVDNLTQIELLAKQRGITEETILGKVLKYIL